MSHIKFTTPEGVHGDYIYIESSKIETIFKSIYNCEACTVIQVNGVPHRVTETPEEILGRIKEGN